MLLAVVNAKNVDQLALIYFAVPITHLERHDVVFTNAAANTEDPPDFYTDPADLKSLKWNLIDSPKWGWEDEEKQARMAEALIHQSCDIGSIDHIITWNDHVRDYVLEKYKEAGLAPPRVISNPKFYYTKYPEDPNKSLVAGPCVTKLHYSETIDHIKKTGQNESARFRNLDALLGALRKDLSVLAETNELIGLESDNARHHEDVGVHTTTVVRELLASAEYAALNSADKRLVEIAAFLHDIGKGPKSRWQGNGGRQKNDPDHPISSVIMLRRILTEEIATIKPRSIRVLAKLVCYHDLVGDIVGKGRNEEQLDAIAETERELDMLIALGKADMKALGFDRDMDIAELRVRVLTKLNGTPLEDDE